jgi:hypothetical protein
MVPQAHAQGTIYFFTKGLYPNASAQLGTTF